MFGHWDGVFFLQIAEYGYEFEKFHAFFPAFPGLMRITRYGIWLIGRNCMENDIQRVPHTQERANVANSNRF